MHLEHCKRDAARYGVQARHWTRVAENTGLSDVERQRRRALADHCAIIADHLKSMAFLHRESAAEKQGV